MLVELYTLCNIPRKGETGLQEHGVIWNSIQEMQGQEDKGLDVQAEADRGQKEGSIPQDIPTPPFLREQPIIIRNRG